LLKIASRVLAMQDATLHHPKSTILYSLSIAQGGGKEGKEEKGVPEEKRCTSKNL